MDPLLSKPLHADEFSENFLKIEVVNEQKCERKCTHFGREQVPCSTL